MPFVRWTMRQPKLWIPPRLLAAANMPLAKTSYLILLIVFAALSVYGGLKHMLIILPLVFVFLPIFLNSVSFTVEEQVDYPKFAFTTPVARRTYVVSKFLLGIIFALLAGGFGLVIFSQALGRFDLALFLASASFAACLILNAFQLLFVFKLGANKGRIIMVAFYFLLFSLSSLLGDHMNEILAKLKTGLNQPYVLSAALAALALVFLGLAIYGGEKILAKKEY